MFSFDDVLESTTDSISVAFVSSIGASFSTDCLSTEVSLDSATDSPSSAAGVLSLDFTALEAGVLSLDGVALSGVPSLAGEASFAGVPSFDAIPSFAGVPSLDGVLSLAGVPSLDWLSSFPGDPSLTGVASFSACSASEVSLSCEFSLDALFSSSVFSASPFTT